MLNFIHRHSRKGGTSGCVETGAFGNEAYILTGYFNIPKVLELTLFNGYDHTSGKQLGPKTGYGYEFERNGTGISSAYIFSITRLPLILISRGKDYNAGGARYNTSYIQGVGIGTITDCLSAIKYNIFDKQKFSMKELMDAMEADFEGYDRIRNLVTNRTPKYGNDDDYADEIMEKVFEFYRKSVTGR